jgi:2-polyprenyl-3-methyl-5-hydroxy-6-metoxy-1,4-benzoquinol methylase
MGRELARRGCQVWGIDHDGEALRDIPDGAYVDTAALDLDSAASIPWPGQHVDVALCLDVLEHLRDPVAALRLVAGRLREGGMVIVSLPNVAHGSVRLRLLAGRFDYTSAGILDRTHLHLYTRRTAQELVRAADLEISNVLSSSNRFGTLLNRYRGLRIASGLLAYNIVVIATRRLS